MKKRFNLTWRVVTALLLLVTLVPTLLTGVVSAAGDTTAPYLVSVGWVDVPSGPPPANGKIDWQDQLIFYWSESMSVSLLDSMGEINDLLDSSATGAPPTAWDYGSTLSNPVWDASGTILTVTLGSDCSTNLSGATVTPKTSITDKAGNHILSSHPAIVIPPSPDTTQPTILSANWVDTNRNGIYDTADLIQYLFSESIDPATIIAIGSYDTAFDLPSTQTYGAAAPLLADFSLPGTAVAATVVTITLGAGETVVGNESITPSNAIKDPKGNVLGASSITLPKAGDSTRPTLTSITWRDIDSDTTINKGDYLYFTFSEAMNDADITALNINDGRLSPAGHSYGTAGDPVPALTVNWDTSYTFCTVTLGSTEGILGGEAVNPTDASVHDRSNNNQDNTTAIVTIPTPPGNSSTTTPTKESTRPVLNSVGWIDSGGNGRIDGADHLLFNFNEAMDFTTLDVMGEINNNLNTPAIGTYDYGTDSAGAAIMWRQGNTVLDVTLGTNCATDLAGKSVNPADAVKDMAGNIDNTQSPVIPFAPDTALPQLLSITWQDGGAGAGNGIMDANDYLFFNFNEAMNPATIAAGTIDTVLESSAPGNADYGAAPVTIAWINGNTQLRVTLGAACSVLLAGATVNPLVTVTDAKGNADGTMGLGPAIPLPPDKIAPYLTDIVWTDKDSNGIMNRGDWLTFNFSEAMNPVTCDTQLEINTVLDTTASTPNVAPPPAELDYGLMGSDLTIVWNAPSYTSCTIVLGTQENLDGGEMVNPTDALTDMAGNPDGTSGSGIMIPHAAGTPASLGVTPTSRTFTYNINGTVPASQTITISNGGTQALAWSVTSPTKAWLNVTPTIGTISGIGSNTLTLAVNVSGLNVSTDTDTITVTGAGSSQAVTVTLNILAEVIPTSTPTATPNASPTATPVTSPTATPTTVPPTPTPTPTPTPNIVIATIGTDGGIIELADKVKVTFPAGAFDTATTVTITSGACTHGDTDAFFVGSTCFSVTPSGALGAEATICVQLSTYDLSLGDEGDLTLGYWADGTWNEASDVTVTGNTICGKTSHLSDWAVLSSTGEGWLWWYWALIGGGAFIVVLAIILLLVLPKRGKGEEIPSEELYGEEEEEF